MASRTIFAEGFRLLLPPCMRRTEKNFLWGHYSNVMSLKMNNPLYLNHPTTAWLFIDCCNPKKHGGVFEVLPGTTC